MSRKKEPGEQRTLREAARALFFTGACNYRGVRVRRKSVETIEEAKAVIRGKFEARGERVPVGRPPKDYGVAA